MSSLRRLPNSPFWIARLTLPNGRRTNRSTKTSDRGLTLRLAHEWQTATDRAREGRFVEQQARKVLNDILASVGEDTLSADTVESFLHHWLEGKRGSTAARYGATVERFIAHVNGKKDASLTAIGHQDNLGFIDSRNQAGVAPKTISVDVRALGTAFNVARKLGLVMANPVEHALTLRPIEVSSSRRDCFTPEQVMALLDMAEGDWRTAVLLGYYTGARLGDCANMRWDNVDFARGVIRYEPQKTRRKNKRVVVPIHADLLAHLEKLASDRPEPCLCPALAGRPTGGKNGLSQQFKRLMAAAGIDERAEAGLGIRRFAKLSFHSLRHSFNSALANGGVDQETRMLMTGHSSAAVNGDYTHLELPKLKAAVAKLPSLSVGR